MRERPVGNSDGAQQPIQIDVIDVPLSGTGVASGPPGAPGETGTNWRRAIAIATLFGTALGIVVGVVLANGDDDPEATAPDTTLSSELLSALITTPPTLQSLDTLPSADLGPTGAATSVPITEPRITGPRVVDSVPTTTFELAPLPTYEASTSEIDEPERFDVIEAANRLDGSAAYEGVTMIDHRDLGFEITATTRRDPVTRRYQIDIDVDGRIRTIIVDLTSQLGYLVQPDVPVQTIEAERLLEGTAVETLSELFDAFVYGPLRPDTIDPTNASGAGFFEIDGVGVVRQFAVAIDTDRLPVWFPHFLGPGRPGLAASTDSIEYLAYVDGAGELRRVDGVADIEGVSERVSHTLTRLDELVITLPDIGAVPTAPSTSQPSSS